jgi:hypothetical protein
MFATYIAKNATTTETKYQKIQIIISPYLISKFGLISVSKALISIERVIANPLADISNPSSWYHNGTTK